MPLAGNQRAAPGGIKFETMERALQVVAQDFADPQSAAAVGAAIDQAANFSAGGAPEDHFFSQTGDAHRLASFYLIGFEHCVPLVADHMISPQAWIYVKVYFTLVSLKANRKPPRRTVFYLLFAAASTIYKRGGMPQRFGYYYNQTF